MAYGKRGTPGKRVTKEAVAKLYEENFDQNLALVEAALSKDLEEAKQIDLGFLTDFTHNGKGLTKREALFVSEYLFDLNATRAFMASSPGIKPAVCNRRQAKAVLDRPHVQAAVKACIDQRMAVMNVNHQRVLAELTKLAFTNITDVIDVDDNTLTMKDINNIPESARAAIKEITETRGPNGVTFKVVMHDKLAALNNMMRHLGMYNDRMTVEHQVSITDELEAARARAEARRSKSVAGKRVFDEQGAIVND